MKGNIKVDGLPYLLYTLGKQPSNPRLIEQGKKDVRPKRLYHKTIKKYDFPGLTADLFLFIIVQ